MNAIKSCSIDRAPVIYSLSNNETDSVPVRVK